MAKQKYTAEDIKKIYEKSLPKVYQAPYKEPVGIYKPAPVEVEKQNSLIGNVLQPFKNIQANYVVGDLGETERKAWSAYRAKQDAESLKAAQKATAETEKYAMANRNVGQGNIVTRDFAQYLPQMKNQIISGLGGAGERAVLGAGAGAGAALIAGQAGPQVLAPEEMITVPVGAVAGGVMGGKAGYMEGVARYSYNQMAGAAYKNLLDLGVPNDIAIKVSGDEALISSLIESAGAGVDIATVGIGKLFSKAPKDAVVKTAKNRLVSALKAYGINILSEAMEEGSQEIVSIQSEKRALKKAGMPERDVTPEEDIARILEAARGGAAVATVSGGLNVAGNIATNAIYNNQIKNSLPTQEQQTKGKVKIEDIIKQNKEVAQEQHDGRVLPTVNTNKSADQSIEQVSNVAQKVNRSVVEGVTDNIQQRQGQIVENVADTDIKISPKYRNKFIRSISDALGVSKYSNKANINSLSDMLVEEIARGNNIDAQSAEILFNTLMDEGVTVDSEFYNLYKDLKNEIKNTRLYVGDDIRAEYGRGEYNNFKKAHFGKLNLTSDRSNMSVDQYYQELSGRHPELFPDNIIVQQDQLGRIADVVNSIVKNEDKLTSLAQNDKEYRQFARAEFDKAINNLKEEVRKETARKLPAKQEQIVAESQRTLPVKEKKTGIQIDDSSENVRKKNPHVYKYIDKLGESVGVKVKFVPEYTFDVKLDDGTVQRNEANGYYNAKENTIVISEGASNPAIVVAKHELTHLMENKSPELYKEYKDYVIDSMKKKGTYQTEVDKLSEAYKGVLSNKDLKTIEDEIISNASELYLEGDRQSIQDIIDYNPSLAQRVHEFIQNIIDKIKTAMGKDTGTMNISQFRQAERLWAEMLDKTIKDNELSEARVANKEAEGRYKMKEQPDDIKASMKKANKKLPTKSQQSILNDAAMRIQEAKKVIEVDNDIAEVLTSSKQKQLPRKSAAINTADAFKRKFVDSGNTIAKVAKITNDSTLYTMFNNAKQSRQAAEYMIGEAQTDVLGNKVGDSLKNIFDPIRKKGNDYYKKFSEYMFHLHNIDRMAQGKPVFGESVTAEMSQVKVNEFEYSNPEFIKYAAKVHEYNQNLMQYRIDSGLVSVEQANVMNEMYPNYVPTYRKNAVSTGARGGSGRVEITQGIKKATGSSKDLLPLHEQMARQTMQVVQAGKRNLFGNRLLSDTLLNRDSLSEYIQAVDIEKADIDIDEMTAPDLRNSFTIYNDGEKTTMKLNTGLYEGVKSMASEGREYTSIERGAKAVNSMFKKLVTAYNPMFTIKNVIRDLQDAGIYTKDLKLFTKNFPIAYKEIITNGNKWQQYQALGGFGSSIFDYEIGYKQEIRDTSAKKFAGFIKDNTYERIEALNFWTEQAPRFTEFLSTLEKGDGSYENLMEAMYNSADVTVNFGRSGTWGKVLNSTFVPFFNPSMQGFSKLIRHFTGTRGVKNWTKLVIRVAALGIAPSLVNSLIYDDDDDFDKIHNRDKDINFLLKIGDDQWVKIPKGRVLSLFGNAAQRTLRTIKDEEDAWAGFISTSADNVLPMNPLKNHILSPFLAIGSNTTWYGTPIEGQGLQAFKPGERYDTRTDSFSIWLGKRLNYSPKKINYLLDAYTGVIGDFALPLMSKKAETNAFKKQFVLDSTLSNKVSTTFYRKIDDLTYEKNSIEEDNVYDVVYRFMNKQRTAVSDLNREIKAIENSDLSNNEQKTKVKEITAIKNGIQLNALDALEEYQKAAEKNFKKFDNDVDNAYLYTNKDMFGAEYALKTYNKNIYQKYLDSGQSAEEYFEEYFTELFAKREAKAAKEASTEVKIKLPTIKTKGNIKLPTIKTTNIKLPTIKDK